MNSRTGLIKGESGIWTLVLDYWDDLDHLDNLDCLVNLDDLRGTVREGGFRYASDTSVTPDVRYSPTPIPTADAYNCANELVPEGPPRFKPRLQPGKQVNRSGYPALKGPTGFASLQEPVRPVRPRYIVKIAVTQCEPWALTVSAFSAERSNANSEIQISPGHRKCR